MKNKLTILLSSILLLHWCVSTAQVFENDAVAREKHFIYEVKQIDEFFERFNDDSASFIRNIYKQKGIKFQIKRSDLIRSLFDVQTHSWRQFQLDSFIKNALTTRMPSRNYAGDEDWFAEAICVFEYSGKTISIPVILQKKSAPDKSSKWLITGVRQNIIKSNNDRIAGGNLFSNDRFISPVSHVTYFIDLGKAFSDKEHLLCYFDSSAVRGQSIPLYNSILKDQIKFLYVYKIKYYFLQVPNYIFTVENFRRDSLNSGWLISQVIGMTRLEKETFKRNLLGR